MPCTTLPPGPRCLVPVQAVFSAWRVPMRPTGPRGSELDSFKKRLAVIAQNLRDLMSRDPVVSANAAERLKELAPTAGELLQVVNDRDQLVRAGAARLLRKVTAEEDAPIVTEA